MTAERSDDLPARVRAIRKQRGLTQQQFAEAAGVGYRSYQNFENGVHRPQPANMRLILDYAALADAVTTLPDFLLARYAEDEREAKAAADVDWTKVANDASYQAGGAAGLVIAFHGPRRVLADVEANRRIVGRCARNVRDVPQGWIDGILHDLALPYADHPDYRQEWKP